MSGDITVPPLGESVVEATVGRWLKAEGDLIAEGESLVELETDKVNVEVAADADGVLKSIVKVEGETVGVGDVLAIIAEGAHAPAQSAAPATAPQAPVTSDSTTSSDSAHPDDDGESTRATPLARRIAEEHGIDLNLVKGSGPSGRVRREDVTAYLEDAGNSNPSPPPAPQPATPVAPLPVAAVGIDSAAARPEERIRMSRRRQTIAQRLVEAQQTAAMLTTFNEVDMSAILDLRKRRRDAFKERYGISLGFMSFFTRAVIGALKAFPRLNAEIQGDQMIIKRYYDIGIAVGVEEGLVVPVLRDADRLTFAEIEKGIADLAGKARQNQLALSDLQGGTFTITNGGVFGSLLSTPILNAPQVGILGMHKIQERPVALNGEVVIRPMMYLALSYDHRIVDGNEAVRFLVRVKEFLEDPESLLLEA